MMSSSKRKEKLSAFLDNNMHPDELMSFSLSGEDSDARIAQRYQMMGDALRGEVSESSFIDVSHAVRNAISDEVTYSETPSDSAKRRNTSPTAATESAWSLSQWLRPVTGMAVAASVAVVMVVTLSQEGADGPGSITGTPLVANEPVQTETTSPVQLAADDKAEDKVSAPNNQIVDPRLINRHLEYATQDALQGRLPLVRAVSYEADKQGK